MQPTLTKNLNAEIDLYPDHIVVHVFEPESGETTLILHKWNEAEDFKTAIGEEFWSWVSLRKDEMDERRSCNET